jgi:hypothetical protein
MGFRKTTKDEALKGLPMPRLFMVTTALLLLNAIGCQRHSEMDAKNAELLREAENADAAMQEATYANDVSVVRTTQGDLMALSVEAGEAAIIDLKCNVDGASVYADGKLMGQAEANYEYGKRTSDPFLIFALAIPNNGRDASKPRKIAVTKNGYRRFETTVLLNQRKIDLNVSLVNAK